jgi:predicted component of type VI protein secretion system
MKSAAVKLNGEGQLERSDDTPSRQQSLKLHMTSPEGHVREMLLHGGSVSIGRSEACTLQLRDLKVSRRHAELVLLDGTWTVLDCGSQNGTFLSGILLREPRRLRPGDILTIGDTTIFVALAPAASASGACPEPAPASRRQEAPLHADPADPCETTQVVARLTMERGEAPSEHR